MKQELTKQPVTKKGQHSSMAGRKKLPWKELTVWAKSSMRGHVIESRTGDTQKRCHHAAEAERFGKLVRLLRIISCDATARWHLLQQWNAEWQPKPYKAIYSKPRALKLETREKI